MNRQGLRYVTPLTGTRVDTGTVMESVSGAAGIYTVLRLVRVRYTFEFKA